mgnify:CR=1 FL=1
MILYIPLKEMVSSLCLHHSIFKVLQTLERILFLFQKREKNMKTKLNLEKSYIAFSAIGNPDKFFTMLKESGVNIIEQVIYPDHHHYSDEDMSYLTSVAKSKNAVLVTTRKDNIKLNIKQVEIEVVDIELSFDDEEKLFSMIYEKAKAYI